MLVCFVLGLLDVPATLKIAKIWLSPADILPYLLLFGQTDSLRRYARDNSNAPHELIRFLSYFPQTAVVQLQSFFLRSTIGLALELGATTSLSQHETMQ